MLYLIFAAAVLAIIAATLPPEGMAFQITLWVLTVIALGVLGASLLS